jgi:hypothetical protein
MYDTELEVQVVIAPQAAGSAGNDLWVMDYVPGTGWKHLSQITGHPMEADIDCSTLPYPAKLMALAAV